ncbi:MAG: GyrI-like domain-containing protein, partial [Phycisphaerae bacterium]
MFDASPSEFRKRHRAAPVPPRPTRVHYAADGRVEAFEPVSGEGDMIDVRIEERQAIRVAFIRHVGPYDGVGPTWQKMFAWASPLGLVGPGTTPIGLCHDDPDVTPRDRVRYDACLAVDERTQPQSEMGVQEIPAGEFAVAAHHGPYERLGETYRTLCGQWLPRSGREPASRPAYEIYLNSPLTAAPEDLMTDIYLPLEPN